MASLHLLESRQRPGAFVPQGGLCRGFSRCDQVASSRILIHACHVSHAGVAWVLWFQAVMAGIEAREPEVAHMLSAPAEGEVAGSKPVRISTKAHK